MLAAMTIGGAGVAAQTTTKVPRLSLQYGDSKCHTDAFGVNNTLPDMGLHLTLQVWQFPESRIPPYSGPAVLWIGRNKTVIPWKTSTGQTCNLLVIPEQMFVVNMLWGYGEQYLFKIPNHPSLEGMRINAQCAIPYNGQEYWSPGTEMIIQKK